METYKSYLLVGNDWDEAFARTWASNATHAHPRGPDRQTHPPSPRKFAAIPDTLIEHNGSFVPACPSAHSRKLLPTHRGKASTKASDRLNAGASDRIADTHRPRRGEPALNSQEGGRAVDPARDRGETHPGRVTAIDQYSDQPHSPPAHSLVGASGSLHPRSHQTLDASEDVGLSHADACEAMQDPARNPAADPSVGPGGAAADGNNKDLNDNNNDSYTMYNKPASLLTVPNTPNNHLISIADSVQAFDREGLEAVEARKVPAIKPDRTSQQFRRRRVAADKRGEMFRKFVPSQLWVSAFLRGQLVDDLIADPFSHPAPAAAVVFPTKPADLGSKSSDAGSSLKKPADKSHKAQKAYRSNQRLLTQLQQTSLVELWEQQHGEACQSFNAPQQQLDWLKRHYTLDALEHTMHPSNHLNHHNPTKMDVSMRAMLPLASAKRRDAPLASLAYVGNPLQFPGMP